MFSYIGTMNLNNVPIFYILHCNNCGNETELLDTDDIKEIVNNRLILKSNTVLTCEKCKHTHSSSEPILSFFECNYVSTPPKSKLPFWMTRDITTEELLGTITYD